MSEQNPRNLRQAVPTSPPPRPNVIWVFGDQHRAQALGCAGDPNVHTPNIDRLAAEGVRFDNAVMGCPLCCPCRGSMLTGRYPHDAVPGHEDELPPEMPTIATAFRDAGYHTAWFGKWHLDGFHERDGRAALHHIPRERRGGFDTWIGYENNNSQWDCYVHGHRASGGAPGGGAEVERYRLPGYETDALTDLLIDHLHERVAQPGGGEGFFAALSVQPPHDPYAAPEADMARHTPGALTLRPNVPNIPRVVSQARRDLAGYYAMIENLDRNLGRIRSALFELGIADHTHIVFFSDHGDMHGSQGQFRKTNPYEEAVRVPFIIGGATAYGYHAHRIADDPVNHVDLAPTTLGLCGIDAPPWMAGHDCSGRRRRDREAPDARAMDSAYMQLVVPTRHGDSTDRPWRGIVTRDRWKYVALEGQPWLMFNLNEDPFEQANLAHNTIFADQRQRLHDRLARWIADTGDTFALAEL